MHHELKIWPQYYCRVADGSKTFEVRKNDRGFQPGDIVTLKEFDPVADTFVGNHNNPRQNWEINKITFKIGYVLPIDAERVVFSLLPVDLK